MTLLDNGNSRWIIQTYTEWRDTAEGNWVQNLTISNPGYRPVVDAGVECRLTPRSGNGNTLTLADTEPYALAPGKVRQHQIQLPDGVTPGDYSEQDCFMLTGQVAP